MIDFQPANEGSDVEAVRKRAYRDWFDAIREAGDFVPVQAYHQFRIPGPGAKLPPPPLPMPEPRIITSSIARPEASRNAVEYAYAEVRKPILVSENGLDTQNDARRIWHIDATLARLQAAMAKGVPVLGYFHWTLIDNFEWESGFAVRYGLVSVDRETFKRTPKPSAVHLGAIARRNAI
jgi:beta-glucosidase